VAAPWLLTVPPVLQCPVELAAPLEQFVVVGPVPLRQELSAFSPPLPTSHHPESAPESAMNIGFVYFMPSLLNTKLIVY